MNKTGTIEIKKRDLTNTSANKRLREAGFLPGIVYGRGEGSLPVILKKDDLRKMLNKLGRNALIKLHMSDVEVYDVIAKEIQLEPISGEYLHVDFQKISLTEEINAEVSIVIIGRESLEMKRLHLIRQTDLIAVRGLPQDIPDSVVVDVTNLEVGETINVGDIVLPKGIISETDANQLVVAVNEQRVSETEEKDDAVVEADSVEE
jgi:large subunit ribosomal protein L25